MIAVVAVLATCDLVCTLKSSPTYLLLMIAVAAVLVVAILFLRSEPVARTPGWTAPPHASISLRAFGDILTKGMPVWRYAWSYFFAFCCGLIFSTRRDRFFGSAYGTEMRVALAVALAVALVAALWLAARTCRSRGSRSSARGITARRTSHYRKR